MEAAENKGLIEQGKDAAEEKLSEILGWALDKASMGCGPVDSAQELAKNYVVAGRDRTIREDAEELVSWQIDKAASVGFLTGLFGPLSMIVGIPASLTAVAFIQLRMIAAIAHMAGYDINDDRVRGLCLICLCGKATSDVLKEAGVLAGQKLLIATANRFSGNAFERACAAVTGRLLVGTGIKTASQMSKLIPLFGGAVNGTVDGVTTRIMGAAAIRVFVGENDKNALVKRTSAISI